MVAEPDGNGGPLAARLQSLPGLVVVLGTEQQAALELLVAGKSVAETARSVGIDRSTIFKWLKTNGPFRAAYEEWRDITRASCHARLLAMTDKATEIVQKALDAGDPKVALALLKGMRMIQ